MFLGIGNGLFLVVGILYERWHTKEMADYGGVWKLMPLFGSIALVIALSSMGLPGLNGFVGEFTIFLGSIGSPYLGFFYTLFGTIGVILAATYILKMYQHVFMGDVQEAPHANEGTYKLHWTELLVLIPILIAIFWIGIQPGGFFDNMNASTNQLVEHVDESYKQYEAANSDDNDDDGETTAATSGEDSSDDSAGD